MKNEINEVLDSKPMNKLIAKYIKDNLNYIYYAYATSDGKDVNLSYFDNSNVNYDTLGNFIKNQKKKYRNFTISAFIESLEKLFDELDDKHYKPFLEVNSRQGTTKNLDKKWLHYMKDYLAYTFDPILE